MASLSVSSPLRRCQIGAILVLGIGGLLQAAALSSLKAASPGDAGAKVPAPRGGSRSPLGKSSAAGTASTAISKSAPGSSAAPFSASGHGEAIWADALPTARPAAPDLLLPIEEERRATAFAYFSRGLIAEDAADPETALDNYRKSFDLDPSNGELAIKLAFLFAQRNDAPSGIQVLKDAVKASPKASLPLIYLSQLYAKYLKKPEQALKYAEQALALDPGSYPAYLAIFDLQVSGGQRAKAEATLQQATKSTSSDPQFWLQVGGLFARVYLREADGFKPSPEMVTRASALYRKAGDLGRKDALVQAKVGDFFADSHQLPESIPFYQAAIQLQPNSEDPILLNAGDKLARSLHEIGRTPEAIAVLEAITRDSPLRFETYELLGELYEKTDDTGKALAAYQRALLLDATEPRNHIRVVYMQMRQKRFAEAVETARAARARFPDDPQTVYLLAISLSQAKKHQEALAAYAEAKLEFERNHEDGLNAEFYYAYGSAAEQAGSLDQAADLLRKSIELAPNSSAEAYNYLGYMWIDRGMNLEEAGEMVKKALASEPDNGAFHDSLGWYYYQKGDFQRALAQLLKAIENLKGDDAAVLDHVGDTYQQLGKVALALQYWQKSLALDAENKTLAEKIDAAKQKMSLNK